MKAANLPNRLLLLSKIAMENSALNWKHGAYIVEWTEKLRTSNRGDRVELKDDQSRNFA